MHRIDADMGFGGCAQPLPTREPARDPALAQSIHPRRNHAQAKAVLVVSVSGQLASLAACLLVLWTPLIRAQTREHRLSARPCLHVCGVSSLSSVVCARTYVERAAAGGG